MSEIHIAKFVWSDDLKENYRVLVPSSRESEESFEKVKLNTDYSVQFKKTRSPRFHKLVMRVIRDLFENQETYSSEEVFRAVIKLSCGWVEEEPIVMGDGSTQFVVKPTNFSDWNVRDKQKDSQEIEFEKFFDKLKVIVYNRLGQEGLDRYRI